MKNTIKRCAYALAFQLAFAAYSNAQSSNKSLETLASDSLKDFNHITIDSASNQPSNPQIPEANPSKEWAYPEENLGTRVYNLSMCLDDISEQDRFRLRYTYYRTKKKIATFYLLDKFPGTAMPVDPHFEGGFTIKMSTEITSGYSPADPSDPVKAYNVKVHDSSMKIERTYNITSSDPYNRDGKKNCLNLTVNLKDELVNKDR